MAGISIEPGEFQYAEGMVKKSGVEICSLYSGKFPDAFWDTNCPAEQAAEELSRLLKTIGARSGKVVVTLCGQKVFSRELTLPKLSAEELDETMRWEAARLVPFDADRYYFDFTSLSTATGEKEHKIFMAAVSKSLADRCLAVLSAASLRVFALESADLSLGRMVGAAESSMIVTLAEKEGRAILYRGEVPIMARSMAVSGVDFLDALESKAAVEGAAFGDLQRERGKTEHSKLKEDSDGFIEQLAGEIRRVLEYCRIHQSVGAMQIFICGRAFLPRFVLDELSRRVELPVAALRAPAQVALMDSLDEKFFSRMTPRTAEAIGALLYGCGI